MTLIKLAYCKTTVRDLPTLLQLLPPKAKYFGLLPGETYIALSEKKDIPIWSSESPGVMFTG